MLAEDEPRDDPAAWEHAPGPPPELDAASGRELGAVLDRLASLRPKAVLQRALGNAARALAAAAADLNQWRGARAACFALTQVAESVNDLESLKKTDDVPLLCGAAEPRRKLNGKRRRRDWVDALLPFATQYPVACVRCAALDALAQSCEDLGPLLQLETHAVVVPALCESIRGDGSHRARAAACRCALLFLDAAPYGAVGPHLPLLAETLAAAVAPASPPHVREHAVAAVAALAEAASYQSDGSTKATKATIEAGCRDDGEAGTEAPRPATAARCRPLLLGTRLAPDKVLDALHGCLAASLQRRAVRRAEATMDEDYDDDAREAHEEAAALDGMVVYNVAEALGAVLRTHGASAFDALKGAWLPRLADMADELRRARPRVAAFVLCDVVDGGRRRSGVSAAASSLGPSGHFSPHAPAALASIAAAMALRPSDAALAAGGASDDDDGDDDGPDAAADEMVADNAAAALLKVLRAAPGGGGGQARAWVSYLPLRADPEEAASCLDALCADLVQPGLLGAVPLADKVACVARCAAALRENAEGTTARVGSAQKSGASRAARADAAASAPRSSGSKRASSPSRPRTGPRTSWPPGGRSPTTPRPSSAPSPPCNNTWFY
ncbi:hypothetical protein JL722_10994 [Aureococcus anophagefferens]|nr:hypothetical protein JL722_10994 [Aureococcus anophagefferens]